MIILGISEKLISFLTTHFKFSQHIKKQFEILWANAFSFLVHDIYIIEKKKTFSIFWNTLYDYKDSQVNTQFWKMLNIFIRQMVVHNSVSLCLNIELFIQFTRKQTKSIKLQSHGKQMSKSFSLMRATFKTVIKTIFSAINKLIQNKMFSYSQK